VLTVPAVPLPVSCPPLAFSLPRGRVQNRENLTWQTLFQQQVRHCCVTNTVLVTNPKHNRIQAGVKKVISIADRCSATAEAKFQFNIFAHTTHSQPDLSNNLC